LKIFPTWVRAAAVKTEQEKYEILQSAYDHQIIFPSPEMSSQIINKLLGSHFLEKSKWLKNTPTDALSRTPPF
jgi:hypothetical protein